MGISVISGAVVCGVIGDLIVPGIGAVSGALVGSVGGGVMANYVSPSPYHPTRTNSSNIQPDPNSSKDNLSPSVRLPQLNASPISQPPAPGQPEQNQKKPNKNQAQQNQEEEKKYKKKS